MSKHTPGPWEIRTELGINNKHLLLIDGDNSSYCVCDVGAKRVIENLSNARLIAAAPELLEACKEALVMAKHWNKSKDDFLYVELCEKAIKKAEGR